MVFGDGRWRASGCEVRRDSASGAAWHRTPDELSISVRRRRRRWRRCRWRAGRGTGGHGHSASSCVDRRDWLLLGRREVGRRRPRGGDEGMSQRVRSDPLGDPCFAGDAPHDPSRCVPVQPGAVGVEEDRALQAFANGQVDGPGDTWRQRHRDELAALAQHGQGAVAAFLAERFDVGTDRLRHPQPVQRQQRHQGVIARRREPSGDQDGAELVAVKVGDVGLVVDPRSAECAAGECSMTPSSSA